MCCDYQSLCGWLAGNKFLAIHAACWRDLALPHRRWCANADAFFPASMMRNLGFVPVEQLIPNEPARKSLAFRRSYTKVVMDYRIGITGAQGSGKTTWLNISTNITESLTWMLVSEVDEPPRCSSRWFYASIWAASIQMEIAKHIELLTRGVEGFVSIAHLLMLWPTRWIWSAIQRRSVYWVSPRYRKVLPQNCYSNFNAIAGLRPGVALSERDYCDHNEHH